MQHMKDYNAARTREERRSLWAGVIFALVVIAIIAAGCIRQEPEAVTESEMDMRPNLVVRLYYGLGGPVFSGAIDQIAADARARCKADVYVARRFGLDDPPPSKKLVIGGASMGGAKAVAVALHLQPRKVDLLLTIDPVPWVGAVPSNVAHSINWRGTLVLQLGRGKPEGVKVDYPFPATYTHLAVIRSQQVRTQAVDAICALAK